MRPEEQKSQEPGKTTQCGGSRVCAGIGMDNSLLPEYDLKPLLKDGTRGKYAQKHREGTNLVVLDSGTPSQKPSASVAFSPIWVLLAP